MQTVNRVRNAHEIKFKVLDNVREYYMPAQERIRGKKITGIVPNFAAYDSTGQVIPSNLTEYAYLTLKDSGGNTFVDAMPFRLIQQMVEGVIGVFWMESDKVDFAKSYVTLDPNQAGIGNTVSLQVIFE